MKRRHLFELEDLDWFPKVIRNYMTDFLRTVAEKFNLFGPAIPIIDSVLKASQLTAVVDLASGGGGQWRTLAPELAKRVDDFQLVLTDKFPNVEALQAVQQSLGAISQVAAESIDATSVPKKLDGLRTMFLSFHHFRPAAATAILKDAVESGTPIAIFEAQQRNVEHLIRFCFSPLMVILLTPFIHPFSLGRLLFTYLIPIVPLAVGWDGLVSVLRTYSTDEMEELGQLADTDGKFRWEARVISNGPQKIQVMIGVPVSCPLGSLS